jgi:hypothetical protein
MDPQHWIILYSRPHNPNYIKKLYLLALGVEGPGDEAGVPLLEEEEVCDPVHGGAALPDHADGEGEEEGHGQPHRVVQRQRQERLLRRQHLHRGTAA